MNLQLCVPYQKCAYSCPMCVARNHKHGYKFDNLFSSNNRAFMNSLLGIFSDNMLNIRDIVFTGECDPTQNMGFVNRCLEEITIRHAYLPRFANGENIEFQTHNLNLTPGMFDGNRVGVISYSIINPTEYMNSWRCWKGEWFGGVKKSTSRMVILLTKDFDFLNTKNFSTMGFDQITFKTLQHGDCDKTNLWIDQNKMADTTRIEEIVDYWNGRGVSIRLDTSCQNAENRYYVFRSDGKLYDSWESNKPIER